MWCAGMSAPTGPMKSPPKGSAFAFKKPAAKTPTSTAARSNANPSRDAVRQQGKGSAAGGDDHRKNRWQKFLGENLGKIQDEEGITPVEAMRRCAERWKELEEERAEVLLPGTSGTSSPEVSRGASPSGSEEGAGSRSRSPQQFSVRGQSSFKTLAPGLKRRRTAEMHQNIITVAQEINKDRQQFQWLRGNVSLWKVDPNDKSRMKKIDRQVGRARTSARSAEQQQARDDKVEGEAEDRATRIELDPDEVGVSHRELDSIREWLKAPSVHVAAKYLYVGKEHASAVANAFQKTGKVPESAADRRGAGISLNRLAGSSDWTREQIQELRMWVIGQARQGLNVFAKPLRAKAREITGKKIARQRFQELREILGVVFSKVTGDGSAKFSRRVRVQRYRFLLRRAHEDRREPHLRPIRVYTDESYCHAHHAAKNTWVLSEKAWRETVIQDAKEKIARGETPEVPSNVVGMATQRGAAIAKPKSGKGGRAVIVNALYAHPEGLSDEEKTNIDPALDLAGPVPGALAIWAAQDSKGDYHGNFTNDVYLHWLDDKLIPAMIELSRKSNWRPVTLILDGASYHSSSLPTSVDFQQISKEDCMGLLKMLRVSEDDIKDLPDLKKKRGGAQGVGSDKTLDSLRAFLKERLPSAPSRAEALIRLRLRQYDGGNGVPNSEHWAIDFEPHYHFELQATEHGWGVVKVDVSQSPVYDLGHMMARLEESFKRLWTPELCRKLVKKCRLYELEYLLDDSRAFARGGSEEDKRCEHPYCTLAVHESEASKMGEAARSAEVRRCRGQCGGTGYHRQCLLSGGMFANDAEKATAWPVDATWCDCGCGDMEDLSDDDDEVVDLTETPGQKRAREDDEKLANFIQQVDCIIASKAAMAAASKGAAGGAARVLER